MASWKERWSNWVGDRDMELSIRKRLTAEGFYGNTAKLARVKLSVVKRPGWVQVYQFEFSAKPIDPNEDQRTVDHWTIGYGLVFEDARKGQSDVKLFQTYGHWVEALQVAKDD